MNNQDPQTAIDYNLYPASARPSEIERLKSGPKTLDAKWLDPECWNGCQSLVYKQERDHFKKCALELGDQFANAKAQVESLEKQCAAMRERLEELLEVHEFIESDHEVNGVPAFHQTTATKAVLDSTTAGRDYFKVCPKGRPHRGEEVKIPDGFTDATWNALTETTQKAILFDSMKDYKSPQEVAAIVAEG